MSIPFPAHLETCCPVIREIFYDHFGEARGLLKCLITHNIDSVN